MNEIFMDQLNLIFSKESGERNVRRVKRIRVKYNENEKIEIREMR